MERHSAEGQVLARRLSKDAQIPAPYVSTILHRLRQAGYVHADRGPGGGYELIKPADDISVYEIVSIFDDVGEQRRCPLGHKTCDASVGCPVHDTWFGIMNRYEKFLCETSIKTLATQKKPTAAKSTRTTRRPSRKSAAGKK